MITPGGRVGDSSPLGHKGKRRVLDDYVRSVAHALMREHGIPKSHAIAIAKNSLKRWARGGGHVRPQVRAGAAAHLGVQKALDSRHVSLATPIAGAGDGPRATLAPMAVGKRKIRPGSIPSGKGRGKFPITDQKSVKSAASLLHKAKGVSKQAVIAHVRAEAKRRGLKLTPAFKPKGAKNLTQTPTGLVQVVDLVGPKGYSHGWIKAGEGPLSVHTQIKHAGGPAVPLTARLHGEGNVSGLHDNQVRELYRHGDAQHHHIAKAELTRRGLSHPRESDYQQYVDPSATSGEPAMKRIKDRTEADHAVMRERAVKMHGVAGGHAYDQLRERNGVGQPGRKALKRVAAPRVAPSAPPATHKPVASVRPISTSIASNQMRKLGHSAIKPSKAKYTHNGRLVQSMSNPKGFKVQKSLSGDYVHVDLHHGYDTGKPKGEAANQALVDHFTKLGYHVEGEKGRYRIHNHKP